MSWATVLKAGLKFMGSGAKATAKTVGHTVLHPQQTIKGMGTATKTAAVGAATGYVAWEKLTTDKSVARIVGDAVVGSDTIDSVGEKVEGVGNAVSNLGETASNAMNSVDIVNDVRQVCLADIKMTEKERMEVIFGIRPKLKLMNKKLQRLTKAVKYTSLGDVWAEIDYHARTGADKKNIVEESMLRWKRAAKH